MKHIILYENFLFPTEEMEISPSKKKAYHLTPDIYLGSIQKEGLTPRTESKLAPHPERIYLYLNPSSSLKTLAGALWHASRYKDKVKKYHILEIDLSQLTDHKFYADPDSSLSYVAIYTNQSIPPSAIKVLGSIPVEKLPTEEKVDDTPTYVREPQDEGPSKWDEIGKMLDELPADKQTISLKDLQA
jgi:hypothetical protein